MKVCSKCKESKPLDCYGAETKGGLRARCKICFSRDVQISKHKNLEVLRLRRINEWHQREARRKGNLWENVDVERVFSRDGYVCQLCREPVDRYLSFPHSRSKSIDHIDAVSNGGPHMYFNVQLAHLDCNISKSNSR